MELVNLAVMGLLGILGASSVIIAKKPDAAAVMGKIAPYQGIIGVVALVLGVLGLISLLTNIGNMLSAPLSLAISIASVAVFLLLGLIFGAGLLKAVVKSDAIDNLLVKFIPYQLILGMVAIGLTVYQIIMMIMPAGTPAA